MSAAQWMIARISRESRVFPQAMAWEKHERSLLKHEPVALSDEMRAATDAAIRGVCEHRGWVMHELNVRTNHVHCVVSADATAERVMNDFKAYGTRRLRALGLQGADAEVWARHGSTRGITTNEQLLRACRYVKEQ